jgi:hypothetical protein
LLAEHGHGAGEQPVQEVEVADAEVGQGVVVDADAAGQPAEGVVPQAQLGQGAGAADALEGGVQPQRHGDARVEGGVAGPAEAGADSVVEGGEVEGTDEVPDEAGLVVHLEEPLQGHGGDDLLAIRHTQPRRRSFAHGLRPTTRRRDGAPGRSTKPRMIPNL